MVRLAMHRWFKELQFVASSRGHVREFPAPPIRPESFYLLIGPAGPAALARRFAGTDAVTMNRWGAGPIQWNG
jgi:hypothetical protein